MTMTDFLSKLKGVKPTGKDHWQALCSGHNDHKRSLDIKLVDSRILVHCFAGCELSTILKPLGLEPRDLFLDNHESRLEHREIEVIYHYVDANGKPFEVVRTKPKGFYQRQPDGKGGYINNVKGIKPTLYHAKDIEQAIIYGDPIYKGEGEKDCDRLWDIGLVATTNPGGVGKWHNSYTEALRQADLIIIPDNDRPGREHANQVAKSCYGIAKQIRILELPNLNGNIKDVSDWLENGGTIEELEQLVAETPFYSPPSHITMKTVEQMRTSILEEPAADDFIDGWLPHSTSAYMLIAGRAGIGKTFMLLDSLHCLASGDPILSHKTKQCRVGFLSLEGDKRKILARFDRIGQSYPEAVGNIYWEHCLPFKLNDQGIDRLCEIMAGLDVVGIDPLRPLVTGDYTSPKDASNFLVNLRKAQETTGTTVILTHHIRKPDKRIKVRPEDLAFEVKGASEYVEAATSVLLLERARQSREEFGKFGSNSDLRELHLVKLKDSPAEPRPIVLKFNNQTMLFETITDLFNDY